MALGENKVPPQKFDPTIESNDAPKSEGNSPPIIVNAVLHVPQALMDKYEASQKQNSIHENRRSAVEAVTLFFSILAFGVLYWTLNQQIEATKAAVEAAAAERDQADTARQTLEVSERPWLLIAKIQPSPFTPNSPPFINFVSTNSGHSPAFVVEDNFNFRLSEEKDVSDSLLFGVYPGKPGAVIPPGGNFTGKIMDINFKPSAEDIERVEKGTLFYYVYGYLSYKDVSGKLHTSGFCAVYNPSLKRFDYTDFRNPHCRRAD